jgi:hypothetical protein
MISSVRNFSVRILDADRFTIIVFQILDIKSNYLPGIVHQPEEGNDDPNHIQKLKETQLSGFQDLNINLWEYHTGKG